jgi:hypothetical protein
LPVIAKNACTDQIIVTGLKHNIVLWFQSYT